MLEFDGKKYRTIAEVREKFPISEKKLKKMIAQGLLPPPTEIRQGTRAFRHYPDEWVAKLAELVAPRSTAGGNDG